MGEGDFMPTGYHRRKSDPKRVQKIREGGKRADQIKKKMEEQHQLEVPVAEKMLEEELKKLQNHDRS